MQIIDAFYESGDTLCMTVEHNRPNSPTTYCGVNPEFHLWGLYQDWRAAGNIPRLYVPPVPPTVDELVDHRLANDAEFAALVDALATAIPGASSASLIADMKANHRGRL